MSEVNKCCEKKALTIIFTNKSDNPDPIYAKAGDSGFDLRAFRRKNGSNLAKDHLSRILTAFTKRHC